MTKEHDELLAAARDLEAFVAEKFSEHDEPCEALWTDQELCPACESNGCIRQKLEAMRKAIGNFEQPWDGRERRKSDELGFAVDDDEAQLMASDRGGRL